MIEAEKIRDNQRFNILEKMLEDKTLLRMHLLGHQYESLTVVTAIRAPFLFIDCPHGFREAVAGTNDYHLRFEFTGKDKIKYIFRTSGQKILDNEICVRFPEFIERIQRRKNFRLKPPLGTILYINAKPFVRKMNVIDISQGGALGSFIYQGTPMNEDPIFKIGSNINHIELIIPCETETVLIQVKAAGIRRIGKDPITGRETCAFQFKDMEKSRKKILLDLIYKIQRDILRNRMNSNV